MATKPDPVPERYRRVTPAPVVDGAARAPGPYADVSGAEVPPGPSSKNERVSRILQRVRAIPEGFVRTYGDIDPAAPRLVGQVLARCTEDLPWHRVVRADGSAAMGARQLARLRREGVPLRGDRVDLGLARLPDAKAGRAVGPLRRPRDRS